VFLEQPQNARVDPVDGSNRWKYPRDPRLTIILVNAIDTTIGLGQPDSADAVPSFEVGAKRLDALPVPNQVPDFCETSPVCHDVVVRSSGRAPDDPPGKLPQCRQ
jgi:hypothetical protein